VAQKACGSMLTACQTLTLRTGLRSTPARRSGLATGLTKTRSQGMGRKTKTRNPELAIPPNLGRQIYKQTAYQERDWSAFNRRTEPRSRMHEVSIEASSTVQKIKKHHGKPKRFTNRGPNGHFHCRLQSPSGAHSASSANAQLASFLRMAWAQRRQGPRPTSLGMLIIHAC
jgi:hypothetical protein